ncbi:MAG: hypothetical protein JJE39_17120 [Vicinamibacteria bacterium]|nr:hypothetical protein [Vicinamibacteria bacterium]
MVASASRRTPSAIDALGEGISHMREKLFPFSFVGWLTLGFVSLLESCGSGSGGGGGIQNRLGKSGGASGSIGDPIRAIEGAFNWIADHMILFVGGLMVVMLVSLLFMWLRSRTIFVYIDDVATGRFDLVRPWGQHGALADSFFGLSLVVQGTAFIVIVLIVGLGTLFVVWARAQAWAVGVILMGVIPIGFIFVLALITAALLDMALRDFIAPIQISRNLGSQAAGGVLLSMVSGNPGLFIGYALLKFLVGIGIGIVLFIGVCLTCCIGALPLVNQTLFQPIYYAERAWSLKLLAQMGDDVAGTLLPPPSGSRYDDPGDAPTGPINLSEVNLDEPQV